MGTLAHPSTVDVTRHAWGLLATLSGTLLTKVHDSRCRTRRAMRAARLRRASCVSNARTDARGARARRVTQGKRNSARLSSALDCERRVETEAMNSRATCVR